MAKIHHYNLYGNRECKYQWLSENDISSTIWQEINPQKPFYLLIPQNTSLFEEYNKFWKLSDVMPVNSTGVKTHRDHFALDFEFCELKKRISEFRDLNISDSEIAFSYRLKDTRDWKLEERRRSLSTIDEWENYLTECLYRPFDLRPYYHHQDVVESPRNEVMKHMMEHKNLGLVFMRQVAVQEGYNHFMITNNVVDNRAFYSNKGTMQLSPLYIYPDSTIKFDNSESERRPNFSQEFSKNLIKKLGYYPEPETVLYYIYSVFHSPTYRNRYGEFLKIDFPRVPITSSKTLFDKLAILGKELAELHLFISKKLDEFSTQFEDCGYRIIAPGHPKYKNGKVIINKQGDGFTGVPEEVWNFYVGGYQVCHKWLKDRKGRTLSDDDIRHYQRIVVALKETITLMQKIDEAIPSWPIE